VRVVFASRWGYLLALLAGLAMPLAFAPFGVAAAAPLALAVVFAVVASAPPRRALGAGYLFGVGYVGLGVYWIFISVAEYGGGPLAAAFVTPLFVLLFAAYPMLSLWVGRRFGGGREGVTTLAALPLAWVALEWVRSWLFTGTTWLTVGYSQIDTPLAGLAPIFGTYSLSLAAALIGGALAFWLLRPASSRALAPVVVTAVVMAAGALAPGGWTHPSGKPLSVVLMQGDVSQDQKWQPGNRLETIDWYENESRKHFGADIILWPETAVPAFYHQVRRDVLEPFAREAKAAGTTIITGVPKVDIARAVALNAVARLGDNPDFYYKRHLVPFGEYVPFRDWFGGVLDFIGAPLGDFSAGVSAAPLMAAGHAVGASVCYEITFGSLIADELPQAELLANVSNDAWFGDSLAPHQHLQMARMRSLETGRYLIRATNTGITAIVNPEGKVVERAPSFVKTSLSGTVQPREGSTPYVRWRDWPVVVVVFAGLLLVGLAGRKRLLAADERG
jgi:apolipoprotein N-acyltransferase